MQQPKQLHVKRCEIWEKRIKSVSILQQKKTFIYKMKQIQVKNYGNTAKMVVIKIGMRIAIYFCKRIDD